MKGNVGRVWRIPLVRTLLYLALLILFVIWLFPYLLSLNRFFPFSLPPFLKIPGRILFALGFLLWISCIFLFALRGRGTFQVLDPPREFVVIGPYRYVRNPMYLGAFGILLGSAFASASPALLVIAILLMVVIHFLVIYYEEPQLERRFGEAYREYCRRVPRWLPRPTIYRK